MMKYYTFFSTLFCVSSMLNFAMEMSHGDLQESTNLSRYHYFNSSNVTINASLDDQCWICLEPLKKRKGSITIGYCKHVSHTLCYSLWFEKKGQEALCYCSALLLEFDPESYEDLKMFLQAKHDRVPKVEKIIYGLAHYQIKLLKILMQAYQVADEMYKTAFDYDD